MIYFWKIYSFSSFWMLTKVFSSISYNFSAKLCELYPSCSEKKIDDFFLQSYRSFFGTLRKFFCLLAEFFYHVCTKCLITLQRNTFREINVKYSVNFKFFFIFSTSRQKFLEVGKKNSEGFSKVFSMCPDEN